jgi:metallophosphoesterase superfamily enzyme
MVHQPLWSIRKAGIIFLGDFWHSRGALPVELLNMAILELQSWQCPAIFIPGNHDQVCDEEKLIVILTFLNLKLKQIQETGFN